MLALLGLNLPFLALALGRHLEGVEWLGVAGVYALLVFLGYYVAFVLVLLAGLFLLTGYWKRLYLAVGLGLLSVTLLYLAINSVVHGVYRLHIDSFWLEYLLTSFDGVGFTPAMLLMAGALLSGVVLLEWGLFRLSRRVRIGPRRAAGLVAACLLAFPASQAMHIVAHETNDTRITGITPQLPFYHPVRSHRNALKYGGLLPMIGEPGDGPGAGEAMSLQYPLHEVPCLGPPGGRRPNILMILLESWRYDAMDVMVSPNIEAFSRRSSLFLNHLSSGNATPPGVFSLFYGLHPTYWAAVKANNAAIDNPVLIDALKSSGYAFGIYADSHFDRHKIKDTVFRGIDIHEDFSGETADVRDTDLTDRLLGFIEAQAATGTPFFGFAFYKSTHFSYSYPPGAALFQPARDLNVAVARASSDATPYRNDYRNSVRHVDMLVGRLLGRMEQLGILSNTIVVITSDHGEEFNDNKANYWGHCGNFTRYQSQVPMVLYVPWREPRRVTDRTGHVDVPPTLLQEGLSCAPNTADYSNGRNLFDPPAGDRPLVVASYVNHAIVLGDDVYVVNPTWMQKYTLADIHGRPAPLSGDAYREALEAMTSFRRGADRRPGGEPVAKAH